MVARIPCSACGGIGETILKYCTLCHGAGSTQKSRTVEIKIPAGFIFLIKSNFNLGTQSGQVVRQSVGSNIVDFIITVVMIKILNFLKGDEK